MKLYIIIIIIILSPSLVSLVVPVDVKHYVYLLFDSGDPENMQRFSLRSTWEALISQVNNGNAMSTTRELHDIYIYIMTIVFSAFRWLQVFIFTTYIYRPDTFCDTNYSDWI